VGLAGGSWSPNHLRRKLPVCQLYYSLGLCVYDLGRMYATDRRQTDVLLVELINLR